MKQEEKNKEKLELRKLYLVQFEKFETKVFLSWMSVVLTLFIGWIYGYVCGELMLLVALFTCFLDFIIEGWRKNKFNDLLEDIQLGKIDKIK